MANTRPCYCGWLGPDIPQSIAPRAFPGKVRSGLPPGMRKRNKKMERFRDSKKSRSALDDDAANDSRDEQERRRKQSDVNRGLYFLPRLGGALGTIELIHMRIRNTQIRHVLPPFVFYVSSGPSPGRTFIHFLSIR